MEIGDVRVTFDPLQQAVAEIARLRREMADLKSTLMESLPRRDAIMGPNLVVNHSFEDGLAGWYQQDGAPVIDATDRVEGINSLKLPNLSSITSLAFPVSPFFRYRVHARMKGASATANGLYVRFYVRSTYPPGGFITGVNYTSYYDLTANGPYVASWSARDHIATPANSAYLWASISFYNWTGGPANAWVDEVYVSPVSYTFEAPTLLNSWVAFGGAFNPPVFMRNLDGTCTIGGSAKSGTMSAAIFTLPLGCRPGVEMRFPVSSNGAYGEISIDTAGNVVPVAGSNTRVQLDGITFPTI
jgi:hypothetical protein